MAEEKYDVIVVGAGVSGLFCANFLAKYGKKTLLLEHNHQPGGLMGGFRRKNFYFDAGDQSFESGGIMFPYLKKLGFYRPEDWEITDYTMAYEHGSVVMKGDQKKAVDRLADLYPDLRSEMHRMFSEMIGYSEVMGTFASDEKSVFGKTGLARLKALGATGSAFLKNRKKFKEMLDTTLPQFIDRFMPPGEDRDKMANMAYRNMPVLLGTGFWYTWFEDYWYYKRGQQGLMDDLAGFFQDNGGVMHCRRTVDQILTEKNQVKGVKTSDGDHYFADRVVYAGALKRLYADMLDPEYVDPQFLKDIKKAETSEPLAAVYLGVDMSHEELAKYLKTHHTLYIPNGPVSEYDDLNNEKYHDSTFVEITWTTMRCPELAPEKKNSIVLQSFTNAEWMNRWGTGGDDFSRPERYKELKEMVADQMIDTACKCIPELKDRIVYREAGTPMSTIRFTLNPDGASCGWKMELEKSFLKDRKLSIVTPYKGLYTIGHFALWPGGVPIAALSGVIAAGLIKHDAGFNALRKMYRLFKR